MGGVEIPQTPRRWAWGGGMPLPTGGRVWEGSCAPSSENFSYV